MGHKHQGQHRGSFIPPQALQRQIKTSALNPSEQTFASVVVCGVKVPTHLPLNWSQVTIF